MGEGERRFEDHRRQTPRIKRQPRKTNRQQNRPDQHNRLPGLIDELRCRPREGMGHKTNAGTRSRNAGNGRKGDEGLPVGPPRAHQQTAGGENLGIGAQPDGCECDAEHRKQVRKQAFDIAGWGLAVGSHTHAVKSHVHREQKCEQRDVGKNTENGWNDPASCLQTGVRIHQGNCPQTGDRRQCDHAPGDADWRVLVQQPGDALHPGEQRGTERSGRPHDDARRGQARIEDRLEFTGARVEACEQGCPNRRGALRADGTDGQAAQVVPAARTGQVATEFMSEDGRGRLACARQIHYGRIRADVLLHWTPVVMDAIQKLRENIGKVLFGKQEAVDRAIICLLARGHLLIEDVPGVGKTVLATALARSVDCSFSRIQLTPDLLPSDVLGVELPDRTTGTFVYKRGPIFANIVLADEINRTPPRTQAALLEAMAEGTVTVAGRAMPLEPPFMLIATQNPSEFEGTYPLPENQLDRFLMRISLGYPPPEEEARVLEVRPANAPLHELKAVVTKEEVLNMQARVDAVRLGEMMLKYLVAYATATRSDPRLVHGLSPRGLLALSQAARASALFAGRDYVIPEDVIDHVEAVCAHRVVPRTGVGDENTGRRIVRELLERVPSPV
jgi:MoxR-like ATPase